MIVCFAGQTDLVLSQGTGMAEVESLEAGVELSCEKAGSNPSANSINISLPSSSPSLPTTLHNAQRWVSSELVHLKNLQQFCLSIFVFYSTPPTFSIDKLHKAYSSNKWLTFERFLVTHERNLIIRARMQALFYTESHTKTDALPLGLFRVQHTPVFVSSDAVFSNARNQLFFSSLFGRNNSFKWVR